jgi:hypothetical protein
MTSNGNGVEAFDSRTQLAEWANLKDEWTRRIVRLVLASGKPPSEADIVKIYELFLQEKRLEARTIPVEEPIATAATVAEREEALVLTKLSDVIGVNAIVPGSAIEFNDGLTILFGENGTGKTGYARILKRMANSRKAEDILSDINDPHAPASPSASLNYKLGDVELSKAWKGERGEAPFTCVCREPRPCHATRRYSLIMPPIRVSLRRRYWSRSTGSGSGFNGAAAPRER